MFDDSNIKHPTSPNHRANGQFGAGNRANPAGRPPKEREKAILQAINEAMPPEEVTKLIKEMIELARVQKSWRGMAAALTFCAAYQVGKPLARMADEDNTVLDNILAKLRSVHQAQQAQEE